MMHSLITQGIRISVDVYYQPEYSKPMQSEFIFAYKIFIKNESPYTVQLMRRHWYIFDSNGRQREVKGDGVIGKQPVLEPGETHKYVSGCHLNTELGTMNGQYTFLRVKDGVLIEAAIPKFQLETPFKLN